MPGLRRGSRGIDWIVESISILITGEIMELTHCWLESIAIRVVSNQAGYVSSRWCDDFAD